MLKLGFEFGNQGCPVKVAHIAKVNAKHFKTFNNFKSCWNRLPLPGTKRIKLAFSFINSASRIFAINLQLLLNHWDLIKARKNRACIISISADVSSRRIWKRPWGYFQHGLGHFCKEWL